MGICFYFFPGRGTFPYDARNVCARLCFRIAHSAALPIDALSLAGWGCDSHCRFIDGYAVASLLGGFQPMKEKRE